MRRAFVLFFVFVTVYAGGLAAAGRDDGLRHPSVQEVLVMMRGGAPYDVMVERVRRMQDVPTLDNVAITALMRKGVPDEVLLELANRSQIVAPCEIPERKVQVRQVFAHHSILRVLREVDANVATDAIVEQVANLQQVPVLDARAITKLTGQGVPDRVLLELVRKQEVRTGCDPARAQLLAVIGEPKTNRAESGTKVPAPAARTLTRAKKQGPPADVLVEWVGSQARSDDAVAATNLLVATATEAKAAKRHVPNAAIGHREDAPAAASTGMGRIRVVAKSSLPVTFLEVFLNGDSVTRQGQLRDGEAEAGWELAKPLVLDVKRGTVVFESELPVGQHEVQAAFGLSSVVATYWDPLRKAHGQRYNTKRAGPAGEGGEIPVCEVREESTCIVLAHLVKRGDGYAIAYDSKMR